MENNISKSGVFWKIGVVILLVLAVAAVIMVKKYSKIKTSTLSGSGSEQGVTNPLEHALKSGLPVVADFGGSCTPCKMMKPILEELAKEYKGRAEILIIDINEYKDLAQKYEIHLLPVQIFFDKSGKDIWRHEGFLEKDKIIEQLNELGVQ